MTAANLISTYLYFWNYDVISSMDDLEHSCNVVFFVHRINDIIVLKIEISGN